MNATPAPDPARAPVGHAGRADSPPGGVVGDRTDAAPPLDIAALEALARAKAAREPWTLRSWIALAVVLGVAAGLYVQTSRTFGALDYNWRWEDVPGYLIQRDAGGGLAPGPLMRGVGTTLLASALAGIIGTLLGFATGIARLSRDPVLRRVSAIYVEIIRDTPLIAQIVLLYAIFSRLFRVVPFFQSPVGAGFDSPDIAVITFACGVVALGVFAGAYIAEVVRAGIESVDRGQREVAAALGMTGAQTMRHVILPQAIRRILPPLTNQFVNLVKDSSLLYVLAVTELFYWGGQIQAQHFNPFEVYITVAALYFAIIYPMSRFVRYLERRFPVHQ